MKRGDNHQPRHSCGNGYELLLIELRHSCLPAYIGMQRTVTCAGRQFVQSTCPGQLKLQGAQVLPAAPLRQQGRCTIKQISNAAAPVLATYDMYTVLSRAFLMLEVLRVSLQAACQSMPG